MTERTEAGFSGQSIRRAYIVQAKAQMQEDPVKHIVRISLIGFLISGFLTLFAGNSIPSVQAQNTAPAATPTPTEEELRLQEQKRILELQRDIELAKKAIREAQPTPEPKTTPPAPTATPLAGEATLENVKLEAEMISYNALSKVADLISEEIKTKTTHIATDGKTILPAKNIAIYDAQVIKDWRFYQALFPAFKGQINDIREQYRALLCQDPNIRIHVDPNFLKSIYCTDANRDVMTVAGGFQTAFATGANLLKSFIDLAALFRTDTKIQGNAFTVDESAFVAELFRALKNKYGAANININLYYPEVFPPRVQTSSETVTIIGDLFIYKAEADRVIKKMNAQKESLVKEVTDLSTKKSKLEEEQASLKKLSERQKNLEANLQTTRDPVVRKRIKTEIAALRKELSGLIKPDVALNETLDQALARKFKQLEDDIKTLKTQLTPKEGQVKKLDEDIKRLTSLNERFLAFVAEFIKVDSNGINALALFVKSEDIENAMKDNESYWLEIKSVSAGGNNRVRKNLLWFFTGPRIDHSGGVIVEYTLYEKSGAVVYSDKLSIYKGYIEPKEIRGPKPQDLNKTGLVDIVP